MNIPVVEYAIEFLRRHQLTVATAESCTAGLVASMMADVPGCGAILEGGYIVYSETAKSHYLGVSKKLMDMYGLTSEVVACELVRGLANHSNANFFISVPGTAESNDSLNGVICFAYGLKLRGELKIFSETIKFDGDRNTVRANAATHALASIPEIFHQLNK